MDLVYVSSILIAKKMPEYIEKSDFRVAYMWGFFSLQLTIFLKKIRFNYFLCMSVLSVPMYI